MSWPPSVPCFDGVWSLGMCCSFQLSRSKSFGGTLHDQRRVRLLFGPYQTPCFRLGQIVTDDAHSDETRRKMSAAHRKRGTRPPAVGVEWSPAEDELVRALSAAEAAARTGRTLSAVYMRRRRLQVADGRMSMGADPK